MVIPKNIGIFSSELLIFYCQLQSILENQAFLKFGIFATQLKNYHHAGMERLPGKK